MMRLFWKCVALLIVPATVLAQEPEQKPGVSIVAEKATIYHAVELAKYLVQMYPQSEFTVAQPGSRVTGARVELRVTREISEEEHAWSEREGRLLIEAGSERGLLQGVYRFLEAGGCRFFAPGFSFYEGAHEAVPMLDGPFDPGSGGTGGSAPKMKFRKLYVEEGISHTTETLKQIVGWMPKAGYNVLVVPTNYANRGRVMWDNWRDALTQELQKRGLLLEVGGHGYEVYLNAKMEEGKLFEQHPEWFGVDEKGKRSRAQKRVFCTSNPEAVAYLTKNVIGYLKSRPEINIFALWPPDGAVWCECEKCTSLGSESDRQAVLLNDIAKLLREELPEVRLETIAYGKTLQPPAKVKLDPSILVDFCPINQEFYAPIVDDKTLRNAEYKKAFLDWSRTFKGDLSVYTYYRKYAWKSLPALLPQMAEEVSWYVKNGADGISIYSEPADWAAYEPTHYMLPRLAWSGGDGGDELQDEYVKSRYPEHTEEAKRLLDVLGDVVRKYGSIPFTPLKPAEETEAALNRLIAAVEKFQSAVGDKTTIIEDKLMLAANYAARDLDLQIARAKKDASAVETQVTSLREFIEEHGDDGVVMNYRGTELPALQNKYAIPGTGESDSITSTTTVDPPTPPQEP